MTESLFLSSSKPLFFPFLFSVKGTHNADSIIESKVIYYLEQCILRV